MNVPSQLIIPHLKGQIYANDIHSHEWVFHPTECGEYNFDIKCVLMAIQNDLPAGTEVSITLHVTGKCEAGLLLVIHVAYICLIIYFINMSYIYRQYLMN